jgi:hypothetical protein
MRTLRSATAACASASSGWEDMSVKALEAEAKDPLYKTDKRLTKSSTAASKKKSLPCWWFCSNHFALLKQQFFSMVARLKCKVDAPAARQRISLALHQPINTPLSFRNRSGYLVRQSVLHSCTVSSTNDLWASTDNQLPDSPIAPPSPKSPPFWPQETI